MDTIIIYKEGESLKEKLSMFRFSYQRKYRLLFVKHYQQLSSILNDVDTALLYYFKEQIDQNDRIQLKALGLNYPNIKVSLCSNTSNALAAWKLNLFHFLEYPVMSDDLLESYKRFVTNQGGDNRELVLKNDGELVRVPFDNLCYLQASGNYTIINHKQDKNIVLTKQLGTFEDITEQDLNINRVHRSLIINLKNIKSIASGQVHFYQCAKPLSISTALESKLKKMLLGS